MGMRSRAGLPVLGVVWAASAPAAVIEERLFFHATGQNPFQAGPAITREDSFSISLPVSRTDFPLIRFPPGGPLYAEAGARTEGIVHLGLNSRFSSGALDIRYPVAASIALPDADSVRGTGAFTLALGGEARPLFRFSEIASLSGGLSLRNLGGGGGTGVTLVAPTLRTSFPSFSARLDAGFEQRNSAFIQGCVDAFIGRLCKDIVSADLPSYGRISQTLASFGPEGAFALPGTAFEAGVAFGTEIPILGPYGALRLDYPTLATAGGLGAGGTLASAGQQRVVTLSADIDRLIDDFVLRPLALPTLSGDIGPASYQLLDLTAGLFGDVYQEFTYRPELRARLDFDEWVRLDGSATPTRSLDIAAGAPLSLRAVSPFANDINVTPTYYLGGTLESETGLAIGVELDVKALKLDLGSLSTGWLFEDIFTQELGRIPVIENSFTPVIGALSGDPFTVDLGSPLLIDRLDFSNSRIFAGGRAEAQISVADRLERTLFNEPVAGRFVDGQGRTLEDITDAIYGQRGTFFIADENLVVPTAEGDVDLGRVFCGRCDTAPDPLPLMPGELITLIDGTEVAANRPAPDVLPAPDGPSLFDANEQTGVSDPVIFSEGPIDPELRRLLGLDPATVPAPAGLGLFGLALGLFAATRRGRR